MDTSTLLESLQLPLEDSRHLSAVRFIVHNDLDANIKMAVIPSLDAIHAGFNEFVIQNNLDETCMVKGTDTPATIRKKCKKAFKHGEKYYPIWYTYAHAGAMGDGGTDGGGGDGGMGESHLGGAGYHPNGDYSVSYFAGPFRKRTPPEEKVTFTHRILDPESGFFDDEDDDSIEEKKKTSTERVRRYYKRHPEKVRAYLRRTVKDRAARNRDRRKAVEKYGKKKMKNHDVHHPNGAKNGNWRLAKKDHGRDKKNENVMQLTERIHNGIDKFVNYACAQLKITNVPTIRIVNPNKNIPSLGSFNTQTNEISVVVKGRLLADILRTIAHELVHLKQLSMGQITNAESAGKTGSPIENKANAVAGILMRNYGKENQDIYLSENMVVCRHCGWKWKIEKDDKYPTYCHKCWNNNHNYIVEGGAHGHLAHPFENTELSFEDFDEMLNRSLVGDLQKEGPVIEKMDGQNIAFTVRDGKVVFARNKGHLKNRAENALSAEELASKFADRGEISDAFTLAAQDIEQAISKLSPEELKDVFGNGSRVMSSEIIYPGTRNVIPYDKTVIVFHGTLEHDDDGNPIGTQNTENGKIVSDAVTRENAQKQKTFGISGPRTVAISDHVTDELRSTYDSLTSRLDDVRGEYNLKPTATLRDYLDSWWNEKLNEIESTQGIKFTNTERDGLVARWVDNNKKFGVKNLSDDKKEWFREFEKTELKPLLKKSTRPFEQIFLTAGVHSLKRVVEFLSANNPEMAKQLKQEFKDTIEQIKNTGGADKLQKLEFELARLKELGVDNIVPSEGIIFTYNGNPYKLTGTFAPVNQIMGTLKYNKTPEQVDGVQKSDDTEASAPVKKTVQKEPDDNDEASQETLPPIAIFPGRFQPYHAGHQVTYNELVKQFGVDNVYIVSSDKQDSITSPFSFSEKKDTITRMFGVPEDKIVQVKSPYSPKEVTEKLPKNTPVVFAVGEKDAERLRGDYFKDYDPNAELTGFSDAGYVWIGPPPNIEVNGKTISGTQLRHVLGSPEFTDRAKQEIFTKVYGKFDSEIFEKLVKVTSKSEEARAITAAHASTGTEVGKSKAAKEKAAHEAELIRQSGVLRQRVQNPDTGHEIYVATALDASYEGTPVQQIAHQMIQSVLQKNESLLMENNIMEKTDNQKLNVYLYTRDYTDKELNHEVKEYFENDQTKKLFPRLAKTPLELKDMIEDADTIVLDREDLELMGNSEVPNVLSSTRPAKILKKIKDEYGRNVNGILTAIKQEEELPTPIVIKHKHGYYLLAGNTRLSALASINHTMPVKVLDYKYNVDFGDDSDGGTGGMSEKELRRMRKKIFNDLMQQRIVNPETGNEIKVDTAMDYNKNHPAHKVAMNFIRGKMAGISNRAGIPKNRKR